MWVYIFFALADSELAFGFKGLTSLFTSLLVLFVEIHTAKLQTLVVKEFV